MAPSWCLVLLGLVALQGLADGQYAPRCHIPPYIDNINTQQTSTQLVVVIKKVSSSHQGGGQVRPGCEKGLIDILIGNPGTSHHQQTKVTKLLIVYLSSSSSRGPSQPGPIESIIDRKILNLLLFLSGPKQHPQQSTYERLIFFFSKEQSTSYSGCSASQSKKVLAYLEYTSSTTQYQPKPTPKPKPCSGGSGSGGLRPECSSKWNNKQYEQTSSTLVFILKKVSTSGPNDNVNPATVNLLIKLLTGQPIPGEPSISPRQRRKTTKLLFVYLASESVHSGGRRPQQDIGLEIHWKLIRMLRFMEQPHPQQTTYERLMVFFSQQQVVGPNGSKSQSVMAYFHQIESINQPRPGPVIRPRPQPLPSCIDNANTKETSSQLIVVIEKVSSQQGGGKVKPGCEKGLIDILLGKPGTSPQQQTEVTKLLLVYLSSSSSSGPSQPGPIGHVVDRKILNLLIFLSDSQQQSQQSTYESLMIFFSKEQTISRGPSVSQSKEVLAYLKYESSTSYYDKPRPRHPWVEPQPQWYIPPCINNVNTQQKSTQLVVVIEKVSSSHQGSGQIRPGCERGLLDILLGKPGTSPQQQTEVTKLLLVYLSSSSTYGPSQPRPIGHVVDRKILNLLIFLSDSQQQSQQSTYESLMIFFSKKQTTSSRGFSESQSKEVFAYLKYESHTVSQRPGPGPQPCSGHGGRPGCQPRPWVPKPQPIIPPCIDNINTQQKSTQLVVVIKKVSSSHQGGGQVRPGCESGLINILLGNPGTSPQQQTEVTKLLLVYLSSSSTYGPSQPRPIGHVVDRKILNLLIFLSDSQQQSQQSTYESLMIFFSKKQTTSSRGFSESQSKEVFAYLKYESHTVSQRPGPGPQPCSGHGGRPGCQPRPWVPKPQPIIPPCIDNINTQQKSTQLVVVIKKVSSSHQGGGQVRPGCESGLINILLGNPGTSPQQQTEVTKLLLVYLSSSSTYGPSQPRPIGHVVDRKILNLLIFLSDSQQQSQQSTYESLMIFFSKKQTTSSRGFSESQSKEVFAYLKYESHTVSQRPGPGPQPCSGHGGRPGCQPRPWVPKPQPIIPPCIDNINTQQKSTQLVVVIKKVSSSHQGGGQVRPGCESGLINILLGNPGTSPQQQTEVTKLLLVYLSSSSTYGPSQPRPIGHVVDRKILNLLIFLSDSQQQSQQSTYESLMIFFSKKQTTSSRGFSESQSKEVFAYLKYESHTVSQRPGPGPQPCSGHGGRPGCQPRPWVPKPQPIIPPCIDNINTQQKSTQLVVVIKKVSSSHQGGGQVRPGCESGLINILLGNPGTSPQQQTEVTKLLLVYLSSSSTYGPSQPRPIGHVVDRKILNLLIFLSDSQQQSQQSTYESLMIFFSKKQTTSSRGFSESQSKEVFAYLKYESHTVSQRPGPGPQPCSGHGGRPGCPWVPKPQPIIPPCIDNINTLQKSTQLVVVIKKVSSSHQGGGQVRPGCEKGLIDILLGNPGTSPQQQTEVTKLLLVYLSSSSSSGPSQPGPIGNVVDRKILNLLIFLSDSQQQSQQSTYESLMIFFSKKQTTSSRGFSESQSKEVFAYLKYESHTVSQRPGPGPQPCSGHGGRPGCQPRPWVPKPQPIIPPCIDNINTQQKSTQLVVVIKKVSSSHQGGGQVRPGCESGLINILLGNPGTSPQQQTEVTKLLLVYLSSSTTYGPSQPRPIGHVVDRKILNLLIFLSDSQQQSQQSTYESLMIFFSKKQTTSSRGFSESQSKEVFAYLKYESHTVSQRPGPGPQPCSGHGGRPGCPWVPKPQPIIPPCIDNINTLQKSTQLVVVIKKVSSSHQGGGQVRPGCEKGLIDILLGNPGTSPQQQTEVTKLLLVYLSSSSSYGPSQPGPIGNVVDRKILNLLIFLSGSQQQSQHSTYESLMIFFSKKETISARGFSESRSKEVLAYLKYESHTVSQRPGPGQQPKPCSGHGGRPGCQTRPWVPHPQPIIPQCINNVNTQQKSTQLVVVIEKVSSSHQGGGQVRPGCERGLIDILLGKPGTSHQQQTEVTKLLLVYLSSSSTYGPSQKGPIGNVVDRKILNLLIFLSDSQQHSQQSTYESLMIFFSKKQTTSSRGFSESQSKEVFAYLEYTSSKFYEKPRPRHPWVQPQPIIPQCINNVNTQQKSTQLVVVIKKVSSQQGGGQVKPGCEKGLIDILLGKPGTSPQQQTEVTKLLLVYLSSSSSSGPSQPGPIGNVVDRKILNLLIFLSDSQQQSQQSTYESLMIFFSKKQTTSSRGFSESQSKEVLAYLKYESHTVSQYQPGLKPKPTPKPKPCSGGSGSGGLRPECSSKWNNKQYEQTSSTLVFILKKVSTSGPNDNVNPATVNLLIKLLTGQPIPGEPSISPRQRRKTTKLLFVYLASESVHSGGRRPQQDIGLEIHWKLIRMLRFMEQPHPQQTTYERLMVFFSQQQVVGPNGSKSQSVMAYFHQIESINQPRPGPVIRPRPQPLPSCIDNANTKKTSSELIVVIQKVSSQQGGGKVKPGCERGLIDILLGKPGTSPQQQTEVTKLLLVYLSSSSTYGPSQKRPIGNVVDKKILNLLIFLSDSQQQSQQSTYESLMIFFSKEQTTSSRGFSESQSKEVLAYLEYESHTVSQRPAPVPRPKPYPGGSGSGGSSSSKSSKIRISYSQARH